MVFNIVDLKVAKKIQKEQPMISGMNFGFRLFKMDYSCGHVSETPHELSFNLFKTDKISDSWEKARETFQFDYFFNTEGKYQYKTFCIEFEHDYFFIYLHRERGDGIDTTCKDSEKYYRFLMLLLKKCGHNLDNEYWDKKLVRFKFNSKMEAVKY